MKTLLLFLGVLATQSSFAAGPTLPLCLVDSGIVNGQAQAIRLEVSPSGDIVGTLEIVNLWHFRLNNQDTGSGPGIFPRQVQVYNNLAILSGSDGSSTFKSPYFTVHLEAGSDFLGGQIIGTADLQNSGGEDATFNVRQATFRAGLSKTCNEDVAN